MLRAFLDSELVEAGVDEAGRGCLAGPVVAAAVILPPSYKNDRLNDSKKLSAGNREVLRNIIEKDALAIGVGIVDNIEIDNINILNATYLAMHKALDQLHLVPQQVLVDGNRFRPWRNIPHQCIIKGDSLFMSIAAASIIAKTHRDMLMKDLDKIHPVYNWKKNVGYPTPEHRKAISVHGITEYHRKSFRLNKQLKFFL
jgi:ribonuclease HII